MMRRALVTGCAGFVGSHLSERLVAEGWHVVGVDCFTPYYARADKEENLAPLAREPRFALVETDISSTDLGTLLAGGPVVFHLAAQPGVRPSFGDGFRTYLRDNLLVTQRLFEAALEADCERVVWASSSSVYGDAETYPCREDETPTRPRSPYGVTKRACEDLARIYACQGLRATALRLFTVYGPRQRPDMAIRVLCEAAVAGATFPLFGDGSQSRDFTHVADAVDAAVRAAAVPQPEPVYNVGGGDEATLAEVIATVQSLSERPVGIERRGGQAGDVSRTSADTTRARRSLGWEPAVRLRDGLRSELDWVSARTNRGRIEQPRIAIAS